MFNILKAIFKLVAALTLVISGIFIGGTIFTAKKLMLLEINYKKQYITNSYNCF